eukprot:3200090-Lingulodinium_polyedra.AAC.1
MFATLIYAISELAGKFFGYLSFFVGKQVCSISEWFGAISEVPSCGWSQTLACALYFDASSDAETWRLAP